MNRSEIIRYLVLRSIGNFLLLFAIFGVFATFGPAMYYEAQYQIIKARGIQFTIADIHFPNSQNSNINPSKSPESPLGKINRKQEAEKLAKGGFSQVLTGPKDQILTPIDPLFSILIPKIGANTAVFPNVDSSKEDEFLSILQKGVAHAKGTVFPGMKGNIYLFAHSADNFWNAGRYNAVFYLLKDLAPNDDVVVFFENRRYNYKVEKSMIAEPSEVSYLVKSQQSGKEQLILQTCWPPGTTWKRLMVIAVPK